MNNISDQKDETKNTATESGNSHTLSQHARHFGRLVNPSSYAEVIGLCGEEMYFYLLIKDEIIEEVKFEVNGCFASIACGEMAAILAEGRPICQAMGISAKEVLENLRDLPDDHTHCSILAVNTLYKAISRYLLEKDF